MPSTPWLFFLCAKHSSHDGLNVSYSKCKEQSLETCCLMRGSRAHTAAVPMCRSTLASSTSASVTLKNLNNEKLHTISVKVWTGEVCAGKRNLKRRLKTNLKTNLKQAWETTLNTNLDTNLRTNLQTDMKSDLQSRLECKLEITFENKWGIHLSKTKFPKHNWKNNTCEQVWTQTWHTHILENKLRNTHDSKLETM